MALKSLSALAKAIDAVKKEAGDFAEHKPLLDALSGVSKQIGGSEDSPKDSRDSADDDYSFATAEKRHRERSADTREGGQAAAESGDSNA